MKSTNRIAPRTYQLVLSEDGLGLARKIEFKAMGADAALLLAQRECRGREAELFEDGRALGRVKYARNGGYWTISSSPARAAENIMPASVTSAA